MNLQERWSRRPEADAPAGTERSAPVFDIATGRPIARSLAPVRQWPWMVRAGVAAAAMTGVIGILNAIDMRSWMAERAQSPAVGARPPETVARAGILPPPPALPDGLPSATPSEAVELPTPSEVAALPPQTETAPAETVLAEPMVGNAPEPARKPASLLVFDAGTVTPDADGVASVLVGAGKAPAPAPRKPSGAGRAVLTKGTLVPAVLESVIDTRKPGTVRAVIGVDVRSADRSVLLVPRSSRLVGQYRGESERKPGRAYVIWTRLVRPDGTEVALASAGEGARFMENYSAAPLVSMVGDAGSSADPIRVRRGEPVRVVASRNLPLSAD